MASLPEMPPCAHRQRQVLAREAIADFWHHRRLSLGANQLHAPPGDGDAICLEWSAREPLGDRPVAYDGVTL